MKLLKDILKIKLELNEYNNKNEITFFIRTPQETNSLLNYFQIDISIKSGVLGVAGYAANLGTYSLQKRRWR